MAKKKMRYVTLSFTGRLNVQHNAMQEGYGKTTDWQHAIQIYVSVSEIINRNL